MANLTFHFSVLDGDATPRDLAFMPKLRAQGVAISTHRPHRINPSRVANLSEVIVTKGKSDDIFVSLKEEAKFSSLLTSRDPYISGEALASCLRRARKIVNTSSPPPPPMQVHISPELAIGGDFVPSKNLVAFWLRAIDRQLADAEMMEPGDYSPMRPKGRPQALAKEFADRVRESIAMTARTMSYSQQIFRITLDRRNCSPSFAAMLVKRLLIPVDAAAEFLELLYSELRIWLAAGRPFEGAWGALVLEGGDLVLRMQKPKPAKKRGFTAIPR